MLIVGFYFLRTDEVACVDCQVIWPEGDFEPVPVEKADEYQCDGRCGRVLDEVSPIQLDGSLPSGASGGLT
jgi:hypothetical protein